LKEQIISGSYIDAYTTKEQGIPYLRVGDIKPFSFDENEDDFVYVSPEVDAKIKIKENDILIARTQATIDKLGTASIADKHNANWATSQHTTRIRVDENKISPFYLLAYLNSKWFFRNLPNISALETFKPTEDEDNIVHFPVVYWTYFSSMFFDFRSK
jgi:restriction endonuclease S subunit